MKRVFCILLCYLFTCASFAQDQDSLQVQIVTSMGSGTYKIKINGRVYRAIPEATMKQLLQLDTELDALKKENQAKDSLLARYEHADFWYDTLVKQQKSYIGEMEIVLNGYKELMQDYKRFIDPWLYFSAGLGASGPHTRPAVMFGVGIQRLRVWGIFQERNSGVLLGTEMQLF